MLLSGAGSAWSQDAADMVKASPKTRTATAFRADKAGIQWVNIPGGTFTMGSVSPTDDSVHSVTVKSFQLTKTLVTNKQYKECVGAGACTVPHVSDGKCSVWGSDGAPPGKLPVSFQAGEQPVVCVDWKQAKAFAKWAGGRLPSNAEWEYAARSEGKDWTYPWGNDEVTCQRAVIDDGGPGCGKAETWPVCSKPAGNTEQGLCDMLGNAQEWMQDAEPGTIGGHVMRGGSWHDVAGNVGATSIYHMWLAKGRDNDLGFRIAR